VGFPSSDAFKEFGFKQPHEAILFIFLSIHFFATTQL